VDRDKCPDCGKPVEEGWRACPHCGVRLTSVCPECGKSMASDWVACPYCGARLGSGELCREEEGR
jgi:DNA-directed RNA polymerase subunit RPC12/RpoP